MRKEYYKKLSMILALSLAFLAGAYVGQTDIEMQVKYKNHLKIDKVGYVCHQFGDHRWT